MEMGLLEDTKGVMALPNTVIAVAEPAVGAYKDWEAKGDTDEKAPSAFSKVKPVADTLATLRRARPRMLVFALLQLPGRAEEQAKTLDTEDNPVPSWK